MKVVDTFNGPIWVVWVVVVLFFIFALLLLSGKGEKLLGEKNFIRKNVKGYNKKLASRITGIFLLLLDIIIVLLFVLQNVLPVYFTYIFGGFIILGSIVDLILINTICVIK